jgi:hypothetical protein
MPGQEIAQLQQLKKFVEKADASEVRQTLVITGDSKISWRSAHCQPYLTRSQVRLRIPISLPMAANQPLDRRSTRQNAPDSGMQGGVAGVGG